MQDLFEEALTCAKLPFGFTPDGDPVQPQRLYKVREGLDQSPACEGPSYHDLLPLFVGHPLADQSIGRELRAAPIIAADIPCQKRHLIIFGADKVLAAQAQGVSSLGVGVFEVSSPEELQFLMAAVREFCGRCDVRRDAYEAFYDSDS
ncbi:MAG: hypothetical protein H0T51_10890 [Pirellulales bacterium]|nr:hypothetical protein [Pirellulales bacterium]